MYIFTTVYDSKILRKLIRQEILSELHFDPRWFKKSIRMLLPTIGFDPYQMWNKRYGDSFTKRRLEAIEDVHNAFKQVWQNYFGQEIDPDTSEISYQHTAKYWRQIWTAAAKDEQKAKKRMLERLINLYILKKRGRHGRIVGPLDDNSKENEEQVK